MNQTVKEARDLLRRALVELEDWQLNSTLRWEIKDFLVETRDADPEPVEDSEPVKEVIHTILGGER